MGRSAVASSSYLLAMDRGTCATGQERVSCDYEGRSEPALSLSKGGNLRPLKHLNCMSYLRFPRRPDSVGTPRNDKLHYPRDTRSMLALAYRRVPLFASPFLL